MSIKYNGGYIPAVGADGTTLVADSSTSTGLRYTAGTVQANPVINAAMQIAQYGTSTALAAGAKGYACDRWKAFAQGSAAVVSRVATGDTTNLPNIQYATRFQRNAGQTGLNYMYLANSFETINSIPFVGKPVTFSFYARAGANYSQASNGLTAVLVSGTGTDQNFIDVAYTGSTTVASGIATLTTTWQRFSYSGTVATTATELAIYFQNGPTGTAGANDYYEVTGVQIDIGSVALPFRTYSGTLSGELAACKRYLPSVNVSTGGNATFIGYAYATNSMIVSVPFDVQARVSPTGITTPTVNTSNFTVRNKTNGDATITSLTFDVGGVSNTTVLAGATLTQGDAARLICNSGISILFTGCEL